MTRRFRLRRTARAAALACLATSGGLATAGGYAQTARAQTGGEQTGGEHATGGQAAENPQAAYARGVAAAAEQNHAVAIEAFRKAVAAIPTWSRARIELAASLFEVAPVPTGEIAEHLRAAQEGAGSTPRFAYLVGRLAEANGDFDAAEASYGDALKLRGDYAAPKVRLALLPAMRAAAKARAEAQAQAEAARAAAGGGGGAGGADERLSEPAPDVAALVPPLTVVPPSGAVAGEAAGAAPLRATMPRAEPAPAAQPTEIVVGPSESAPRAGELRTAESREAALAAGRALLEAGKRELARAYFEAVTQAAPDLGPAWVDLAAANFLTDSNLAAVEQNLMRASRSQQNSPRYHYWSARYFEAMGDDAAAIASYRRCEELRAGYGDAAARLALLERAAVAMGGELTGEPRGEVKGEVKGERAQARRPVDLRRYMKRSLAEDVAAGVRASDEYARARGYLDAGDGESALYQLRRALGIAPLWADAHRALAGLLLDAGLHADEAERSLHILVQVEPRNAANFILLARHAESQGHPIESVNHLTRAGELAPMWAEPKLRLAALLDRTGRTGEAVRVYAEIERRFPTQVGARLAFAALLDRANDAKSAEERYTRLVAEFPANRIVLEKYRDYVARRGDAARAKTLDEKVKALRATKNERSLRPLLPSKS